MNLQRSFLRDKIYSKNVQLKPICEIQKNDYYIFCIPHQAFNTDFAPFGAAVFLARLYPSPEELGFSLDVDKKRGKNPSFCKTDLNRLNAGRKTLKRLFTVGSCSPTTS